MTGWIILFAIALAARLGQSGVLWVEESYPAAAAIQMLHGSVPYRDFVFDKPPLSAAFYLLWGAHDGWILRVAGALYVTLCARLAFGLAACLWNTASGWLAAALIAFSLTFYHSSVMMALSPDMLLVAPHLAAIWAAAARRPVLAGALCGLALHVHTKAVFIAAACLLWGSPVRLLSAFFAAAIPPFLLLPGYWPQVWEWGMRYSRDTHLESPLREGLLRTLNWLGFHAAITAAGAAYWWKTRDADSRRLLGWALLSLAAAAAGWRFFPRYFLQLLPALVIPAVRGLAFRSALALLLLIPLIRFTPSLVRDPASWSDLAMGRDADRAAELILTRAHTGDTILVWGYRPEILVRTRLRLGAPFLDSQPLTGVLADRHLRSSQPTYVDLAEPNRARLRGYRPAFVVDGLGRYNPGLAITRFPDLEEWLASYDVIATTQGCVIYKLR